MLVNLRKLLAYSIDNYSLNKNNNSLKGLGESHQQLKK